MMVGGRFQDTNLHITHITEEKITLTGGEKWIKGRNHKLDTKLDKIKVPSKSKRTGRG